MKACRKIDISVMSRHVSVLEAFCSAKSAMQQVEYRAKAREVEVVVRERQRWARRQRALCEWLSEGLRQATVGSSDSQLAILQQQVPQHAVQPQFLLHFQ